MPQLIGALWVRPVSLVSNKSMCFVVFVKEKQNAWSGLYDAKKEITYAIYVFKEKLVSWSFTYLYSLLLS